MDFEVRRRVECANIESAAEGRNLWWHDWCQQRHSSGAALWSGADVESGGVESERMGDSLSFEHLLNNQPLVPLIDAVHCMDGLSFWHGSVYITCAARAHNLRQGLKHSERGLTLTPGRTTISSFSNQK